jgi:hypothetical protein
LFRTELFYAERHTDKADTPDVIDAYEQDAPKSLLFLNLHLYFQTMRSWWFTQVLALLLVFGRAHCIPMAVIGTLRNFRDVLIAPETTRAIQNVTFDPDAGIKFRNSYQSWFGYKGVDLIDKLGGGYTKEQLIKLGAVTP